MSQVIDISVFTGMPDPGKVRELESHLKSLPQVDLQAQHVVHGGMYARYVFIPKDTLVTGALTEIDNICVVVGDITVTTDEGSQRLAGFHVLPAKKGAKRAGYAHADTWWATLHTTALTDITAIEDEMTTESQMLQTRRQGLEFVQPAKLEA